jgi:hypothetical protein
METYISAGVGAPGGAAAWEDILTSAGFGQGHDPGVLAQALLDTYAANFSA